MKSFRGLPCAVAMAGLLCASAVTTCGDDTVYVQVNISPIPAKATKVVTDLTLSGKSYGQQVFDTVPGSDALTVGFKLPPGSLGDFKVAVKLLDAAQQPVMRCDKPLLGEQTRPILGPRDNSLNVALDITFKSSGTTNNIFAAATDPTGGIWAAGQGGYFAHWNGCYWENLVAPNTYDLLGVFALSPTSVWVVGSEGANVVMSEWNGKDWLYHSMGANISGALFAVWGTSANEIWAVGQKPGPNGLIVKWNGTSLVSYTDGGDFDNGNSDTVSFSGLSGLDSTHIYAVGKSNQGCNPTSDTCRGNLAVYSTLPASSTLKWRRPRSKAELNLSEVLAIDSTTIWIAGGPKGYLARWNGVVTTSGADYLATSPDPVPVVGNPTDQGLTALLGFKTNPDTVYYPVFVQGRRSQFYQATGAQATRLAFDAASDEAITGQLAAIAGTSATDMWIFGYTGQRLHFDGKTLTQWAK